MLRVAHLAVVAVAVAGLLAACSDESASPAGTSTTVSTDCPSPADQTDVPYVDGGGPEQRLDVYMPADAGCEPLPLVVWIHGGGWRAGDKGNGMEAKVALWNAEGWAVASVNYRLTDVTSPIADRIVAPSHNEDVASALAWLVAEETELGMDADRIALLGHSAGAGIVAAVSADPTYLGAHVLDPSLIACSAPLDTEGFDIASVMDGGGQLALLYRSVFGDDAAAWTNLSPISHLGEAPLPDTFLVTRGTSTRRAQVAEFAEATEAAGGAVTLVDLPSFSHEDVNKRIGDPADDILTPALQGFLTRCFSTQ